MKTIKPTSGGWIKRKPARGTKLKALWADPTWKAAQVAAINDGKADDCMAAHQAERKANPNKFSSAGIPHGHTRASVAPLWAEARLKADRFIQNMKDEGELPTIVLPDSDDARAEAALREVYIMAIGPGEKQAKLAACRTLLEYSKAKPASRQRIDITTSEDWLAEIAADNAASD